MGDSFARRQTAFFVLRLDGFRPAAFANLAFLVLDFREAVNHLPAIGLESRGLGINPRFDDGSVHSAPLQTDMRRHVRDGHNESMNCIIRIPF